MFKKVSILKNFYFIIFDFIFCLLKLNKRNNEIKNKNIVIWLAETGSRDFIPRLAQALALWQEYKIPSLVIHKHYLRKLGKTILAKAVVIDKSATISCLRRLRYAKLNGSFNIVIPEELLICDRSEKLIKGSLHRHTLRYIDAVVSNSDAIKNYLKMEDNTITNIKVINPRLCTSLIEKMCKFIETPFEKNQKDFNYKYILINDKLSLKFSSFKNEVELIKNNIFKSTNVDAKEYIDDFIIQEEKEEKLLIDLIKKIRDQNLFNQFKIIIRPHPAVDIKKYKNYFKSKLSQSFNYSIIRKGTVIECMQSASLIFHSNCTSAIEGYFKGINNIYNFSSEFREGTSYEFMDILNPLGLEGSIKKAKENYLERNKNQEKDSIIHKIQDEKNIYQFLGEKMNNRKLNILLDNSLIDKFDNEKIMEFSAADRWSDAEKRIKFINKNKRKFRDMGINTLGNIGVQIGKNK